MTARHDRVGGRRAHYGPEPASYSTVRTVPYNLGRRVVVSLIQNRDTAPVVVQKENGYWHIVFYQRGKPRKWVATGIKTRPFADWKDREIPHEVNDVRSEWAALWRDGRYDPWNDERPGLMSVKGAVERYLDEKDVADSTIKAHRHDACAFHRPIHAGSARH